MSSPESISDDEPQMRERSGGTKTEATADHEGEAPLEEAAEKELDYVRGRLQETLGREPTEQEVSDWLRQHTEGY